MVKFENDGETLNVECAGQISFINCLDAEIAILDKIKTDSPTKVVFIFNDLKFFDVDGVDCFKNIQKKFDEIEFVYNIDGNE